MNNSAEQLAIAIMAMARRLFEMGGTIGHDEHGFRNMGDQLAGWASDVRQLGVNHFADMATLEGQKAHLRNGLRKAESDFETVLDHNRKLVSLIKNIRNIVAEHENGDDDDRTRAFVKISEVLDD